LLSLVVPVFNEEESIDLFLDTVAALMERDGLRFEIVFVNDGSRTIRWATCSTAAPTTAACASSSVAQFRKEAALTAGIDHARGDVIVPMDIDLQDPPELIEPFMARWREGYDVVYGVRTMRSWIPPPSACRRAGSTGCSTRCRRCASPRTSATSAWSTAAPSRCCASFPSATAS